MSASLIACASCGGEDAVSSSLDPLLADVRLIWEAGGANNVGAVQFTLPRSAAIGPDGVVAVADQMLPGVILLDREGRELIRLGSRGHGPGEMQSPLWVGFRGDTVVVWDSQLRRVTWFGTSGEVIRTRSVAFRELHASRWRTEGGEPLLGGWILEHPTTSAGVAAERVQGPVPVLLRDPEDRLHEVKTLEVPGPFIAAIPRRDGWHLYHEQPLSAKPIVRGEQAGHWFFTLERAPTTDSIGTIRIVRYGPTGAFIGASTLSYRPVTPDHAALMDSMLARILSPAFPSDIREGLDLSSPEDIWWIPGALPPVSDALADESGFWLRREPFLTPALWERRDLDGDLVATLRLPPRLRILAGTAENFVAVGSDSLDVPFVRLYRVVRNPQ